MTIRSSITRLKNEKLQTLQKTIIASELQKVGTVVQSN